MRKMSHSSVSAFAAVALALALCPSAASATERSGTPIASSYRAPATSTGVLPFTLIVLGTRYYTDVSVLTQNLKKSPSVRGFVSAVSSQRHLEFKGGFAGNYDELVADVKTLLSDRFGVSSKKDRQKGMVITLKKLGPSNITHPPEPQKTPLFEQSF